MKNKVVLEYYADQKLIHRIPVNESGSPIFDWGETVPGERKEKTFFVKNVTPYPVTIRQPHSYDEDFKIKDFPVHLKADQAGEVVLEFAPQRSRIKPLTADWSFEILTG